MKILLLFDIDGTLLQFRNKYSIKIFNQGIQEFFNLEIDENKMPEFAGRTDISIIKDIFLLNNITFDFNINELKILWEYLHKKYTIYCNKNYIELLPGIDELLKFLKKRNEISLGLLTGNFKLNAFQKLKTYKLDKYFLNGSFGDDHEDRNKLFDIALSRINNYSNNFSRNNTILIGDSLRDIECSKSNNVRIICTATGYNSKDELERYNPNIIFDDLTNKELFYESCHNLINNKL